MAPYKGFDPEKDVPDQTGKVFLITGGTGGVGKTAVIELAKHNPGHIYFTGRNTTAAEAVVQACKPHTSSITFLECDHASLASVEAAASRFAHDRLDVFVANAGIMACPAGLTPDGFEVQFGVNHVGNVALLLRLLPTMLRTARDVPDADVRYVALSSLGYRGHMGKGVSFDKLRSAESLGAGTAWQRYSQSKLANIVFARALARRHGGAVTSLAIHPGVVATDLVGARLGFWNRLLVRAMNPRGYMTPEQGALNTVWAATGRDVREKVAAGKAALFVPVGEPLWGDEKCWDDELGDKLWEWTLDAVGVKVEEPAGTETTGAETAGTETAAAVS